MAFQKGFVEVTVEILAAQGAFLSTDTPLERAYKGDPVFVRLVVAPLEGYDQPIYLRTVNFASSEKIFSVNPVPAGGGESIATLNIEAVGTYQIGFEAVDVLPEGEEIQ